MGPTIVRLNLAQSNCVVKSLSTAVISDISTSFIFPDIFNPFISTRVNIVLMVVQRKLEVGVNGQLGYLVMKTVGRGNNGGIEIV